MGEQISKKEYYDHNAGWFTFCIIFGLVIFFTTAVSCDTTVYKRETDKAFELCQPNGGLKYISADKFNWSTAYCKNGAVIPITFYTNTSGKSTDKGEK